MTSTKSKAEIVKQGAARRVRVSPQRREEVLDEFERSAVSGAKFARLAGIKYSTFANWVARRRRQRLRARLGKEDATRSRRGPIRLFEAVVETEREEMRSGTARGGLRIELPGGSRVAVGTAGQLPMAAELVALVAQRMEGRC